MSVRDAPVPTSVLFARGVIARLKSWPTLSVAVQENWGGPNGSEKRTWLASVVVDTFEEQADTPDDQYIEEMLLQVMSDEYDTEVEDGSAEPVAIDICKMWAQSRSGSDALVVKYEAAADRMKSKKVEVETQIEDGEEEDWEDDESGDDEDMDTDEPAPQLLDRQPKPEPEVDEDGFTMVKGKGRR